MASQGEMVLSTLFKLFISLVQSLHSFANRLYIFHQLQLNALLLQMNR